MTAKFKVGDLVKDIRREGTPFGIVTRGDYVGSCGSWVQQTNGQAYGIHVDVLIEGEEFHCLPEWLEKVNG